MSVRRFSTLLLAVYLVMQCVPALADEQCHLLWDTPFGINSIDLYNHMKNTQGILFDELRNDINNANTSNIADVADELQDIVLFGHEIDSVFVSFALNEQSNTWGFDQARVVFKLDPSKDKGFQNYAQITGEIFENMNRQYGTPTLAQYMLIQADGSYRNVPLINVTEVECEEHGLSSEMIVVIVKYDNVTFMSTIGKVRDFWGFTSCFLTYASGTET